MLSTDRRSAALRLAAALAAALAPLALAAQAPDPAHDHAAHQHAAPPPAGVTHRLVEQGLALDLAVEPVDAARTLTEEASVRVRLSITDTLSSTPMTRLAPAAWMDRGSDSPADCGKKIESFLSGSMLSRPEVDLNAYYVLALNDDASISVVDPLFGYGSSKLLAMVFLESPGEDWALSADGNALFVSLPDSDRVAVADTASWKVTHEIATGVRPRRVVLQPDGHYLWVAWDGPGGGAPGGVTAIDARGLQRVADIPTGKGSHDLAISDDSRYLFVTNGDDGTVSVIEVTRLAKLRDVPAGERPVSVDWSARAATAWVAAAGGSIVAIDPKVSEPVAQIKTEPGLGALRFAPGGRLAFVVHPSKNQIHIVDAAIHRLVQSADVEAEPDQVGFSDELAYVRHRGSEIVLMVPLKTVGEPGRPVPLVDFPGGEKPPGRTPLPSPAAGIVAAPGGHPAVLVANPEDKAIYYYREGMAAPMGHFQNYSRRPRAVLVVDRSLRETQAGVYETVASLGPAGAYQLALFLDTPRVVHCFSFAVAENPVLATQRKLPVTVEIETEKEVVTVGEEVAVRLRLSDPAGSVPMTGLRDVRVLTFLSPGTWQERHWAAELGDGRYEVRFKPPEAGVYFVFVLIDSVNLPYQKSPFLVLTAEAPGNPGNAAGGPS